MAVNPQPDFPKPEWPPIQNVDSIDIAGKRKDGGVDLVIMVSQPLDGATETLNALRQKIDYYLEVIELPEFLAETGNPPRGSLAIVVSCKFPIHPWAAAIIAEYQSQASTRGVQIVVKK